MSPGENAPQNVTRTTAFAFGVLGGSLRSRPLLRCLRDLQGARMTMLVSNAGSIGAWAPAYDRPSSWRDFAACRGMDSATAARVFFPDAEDVGFDRRHLYDRARAMCADCCVVDECLADALADGLAVHGFRGGMTPRERRNTKHARNRAGGRL